MRSCCNASRRLIEPDGLRGEGLLAEVEVGDFGLGAKDVPARGIEPLRAFGQMLAGLLDGPLPFFAALLELPHSRPQIAQPLFALGQLDFDLGGFAVGRQPPALQSVDPLADLRGVRFKFGQRRLDRGTLFAGFVEQMQGGVVLLLGVVQLAIERHPLPVQLAAALFGGGNGQAVFG